MKKLIKGMMTMAVFAAAVGGIYYVWKKKAEDDKEIDDFDDFSDLEDTEDMEEEEKTESEDTENIEDERGYVTLKMHKDKEEDQEEEKETEKVE